MLYSGSMDQTIKVWNLDTFECTVTLHGHTGPVTSLRCWDNFLLSGSSDCTIKVWAATEEGPLKVIYSQNVENTRIWIDRGWFRWTLLPQRWYWFDDGLEMVERSQIGSILLSHEKDNLLLVFLHQLPC
ncbi:zinc finger CCCH domain-containing protein 62-like isoform X2 [Cicer arietinum]|uniref:Zinc finger CCCH domain-containing protein 62-like isoform X2 n=1 Tax=Cicer arietinum TaxID=3827 RepID=A0A1S2YW59_CICAR|nr:zinc finger CCCH domain-containing protein 62-like isoform X2 [Cicer arietinum]